MLLDDVPSPEDILSDPAASWWLKESLRGVLARDPVDVAAEAMVLANVLDARASSILVGSMKGGFHGEVR